MGFSVETTTPRPVAFGPDGARANGFLARCPDGECVDQGRYRTWFGGLFESVILGGTLDTFDPVAGRLVANVTMTDDTPHSLETGSLSVEADFSWRSEYVPVIQGALGARWHLYSTEDSDDGDFSQYLELSQTGYAIAGRLCDADFTCQDSDLTGKLADPHITFSWTDAEGAAIEVNGYFDDTSERFSGTAWKKGNDGALWDIRGESVN